MIVIVIIIGRSRWASTIVDDVVVGLTGDQISFGFLHREIDFGAVLECEQKERDGGDGAERFEKSKLQFHDPPGSRTSPPGADGV